MDIWYNGWWIENKNYSPFISRISVKIILKKEKNRNILTLRAIIVFFQSHWQKFFYSLKKKKLHISKTISTYKQIFIYIRIRIHKCKWYFGKILECSSIIGFSKNLRKCIYIVALNRYQCLFLSTNFLDVTV